MKQKNKRRSSDSHEHTVDDFSTGTVVSYSFLSFFCYERVLLRRLAAFQKRQGCPAFHFLLSFIFVSEYQCTDFESGERGSGKYE